MSRFQQTEREGQALIEFALIIGVLFLIIFIVIESGHLLHANLTVQSAAREAGRYAITGQFDTDCLTESPPCADPRVHSVKALAREKLAGLSLNDSAVFEEAGYFLIEVFGTNAAGEWVADSTGMPGRPILVRVSYRAPIWTPLLRPIAETVMVTGQTIMNNEKVVQLGTAGDTSAPPIQPPPPIRPAIDLVMDKSGPTLVMENSSFSYVLTVTNIGGRNADSVTLSDPIDSRLSNITLSDGSCVFDGSAVNCNWSSINVGGSRSVTIDVTVDDATADGQISNTASVTNTGSGIEDITSNNSDTVVTDIIEYTEDTDLQLTKTGPRVASVSTAELPHYIDYLLTVTNNGPNPATNVEVTDYLPSGLVFVQADSYESCVGTETIVCTIASLPSGTTEILTIRVRTPESPGALTNVATVPTENDPDTGNNESSVETEFSDIADLTITKVESADPVIAGEELIYYIQVQNHPDSAQAATGVYISDPLPISVHLQSAEFSAPDGNGTCDVSGNVVLCHIGTLQPGESATATIVVVPMFGGTIVNTAQVAGEQSDPNLINSAEATTTVNTQADVSIDKSGPIDIYAGDLLSYRLIAHNAGPSRATNVIVVDDMPPARDVVFLSAQSDRGLCDWDAGTREVTCGLGTMAVDATSVITITAVPIRPGDGPDDLIENNASISARERDVVQNNNGVARTSVLYDHPFIVVQPACAQPSTPGNPREVEVTGYFWSPHTGPGNNTRDITLQWLNGQTVISNAPRATINNRTDVGAQGYFQTTIQVPTGINNGSISLRATQRHATGNGSSIDIKDVQIPCPGADLVLAEMSTSTTTVPEYQPVDFNITVSNTGNGNATLPFYVSLYAFDQRQDLTLTTLPVENRLDSGMIAYLNRGQSRELTLRAHDGFLETGTHYIYALVDSIPTPRGSVVEVNESNNLFEVVVEVTQNEDGVPAEPLPGTGELSGSTYIELSLSGDVELQPFVHVTVYNEPGGIRLGSTFSSYPDARYEFTDLPNYDTYYVEASITVNGRAYVFPGTGSGIVSPPIRSLILEQE